MLTITPFVPHFNRDGNVVLHNDEVYEADRVGNLFKVTYVVYTDKKGKTRRDVRYVEHIGK